MRHAKKLLMLCIYFFSAQLHAKTIYEIPEEARYTVNRSDGSEGGPLVLSLTLAYPNETLATVNWAGAGDGSWPDQLWDFFYHDSWMMWLIGIYEMPWFSYGLDKKFDEIKQNPSPEKWFCGMTYRYHADVFVEEERNRSYTTIRTPLLVVTGTNDTIINKSDVFVCKAQDAGVPITYYRVDGMGHGVIDPKFDMIKKTLEWIKDQLRDGD